MKFIGDFHGHNLETWGCLWGCKVGGVHCVRSILHSVYYGILHYHSTWTWMQISSQHFSASSINQHSEKNNRCLFFVQMTQYHIHIAVVELKLKTCVLHQYINVFLRCSVDDTNCFVSQKRNVLNFVVFFPVVWHRGLLEAVVLACSKNMRHVNYIQKCPRKSCQCQLPTSESFTLIFFLRFALPHCFQK